MATVQIPQSFDDLRKMTEDVSTIAEQFNKLYYDSIDTKRHLVSRLYMDTAVLVWNGNPYQGLAEIQKFYEQLPTTSHNVHSVDSQLLSAQAVGTQKTLLIMTAGRLHFLEGSDKASKQFQQSFIVTAQGDKWKIVSDTFRFQVPLNTLKLSPEEEALQLQQVQLRLQQEQQAQLQLQQQQLAAASASGQMYPSQIPGQAPGQFSMGFNPS